MTQNSAEVNVCRSMLFCVIIGMVAGLQGGVFGPADRSPVRVGVRVDTANDCHPTRATEYVKCDIDPVKVSPDSSRLR